MSWICLCLGTGMISASFQEDSQSACITKSIMNNIIFCNLGQDRGKGDRLRVLVDVLDMSLFGDWDDICLFPGRFSICLRLKFDLSRASFKCLKSPSTRRPQFEYLDSKSIKHAVK